MGISIHIWFYNFPPKKVKKNMFSRVEISIRQFWRFVFSRKIVQNSIFIFLFNCNTSTHLFWIESISFLWVLDGISFQYYLMQDFKVSLSSNWHLFLYTLVNKIPHKFSIGFKSRNLVDQSKTSIFFLLNQSFKSLEICMAALSC